MSFLCIIYYLLIQALTGNILVFKWFIFKLNFYVIIDAYVHFKMFDARIEAHGFIQLPYTRMLFNF